MDILNNRDWALIIWFIVLVLYIGFSPKMEDTRKSFNNVVSAFFVKQILTILLLMLAYITGIIYFLHEYGIWEFNQIKNTLVWMFIVGFLTLFKLESIKNDKSFFKHSVLANLKLVAIIQFIIGVYPCDLLIEIALVPFFIFMGFMIAFAESDKDKYHQVLRVLNGIMVVAGIIIISYAILGLFTEFDKFAKEQTAYDFIIPPLLTLLYLPFIFVMMIYTTYENVFVRVNYFIKKPLLRFLSKLVALIVFNVRTELLERWAKSLVYSDTDSYKGVWKTYQQMFKVQREEKNPKFVPVGKGWSPYKAKYFLQSEKLVTGDYHFFDGEWFASSQMLELGDDIPPSNIAFYIDGDEEQVKYLKLKLNVNDKSTSKESHEVLLNTAKILYRQALDSDFPNILAQAILDGEPTAINYQNFKISIQLEEFPDHSLGGYEIKFTICC